MEQFCECSLPFYLHQCFTADLFLVLPEAIAPHARLDELKDGAFLDFQVLEICELVLDGIFIKFLAVPVLVGSEPLERPAALDSFQDGEQ